MCFWSATCFHLLTARYSIKHFLLPARFRLPPTSRQPCAVHHTRPTFDEFGQEVCGPFRLFDPVPLHDLSVSVDPDVPGSTRLGLPVQDGRVGDVVVLEHTLLELTLRREVLLEHTHTCIRSGEKNNKFEVSFFISAIIYIFIWQLQGTQLGMGGNGAHISLWQGYRSICGCINTLCALTHTQKRTNKYRHACKRDKVVPEPRCHNSDYSVHL